MDWNHKGGAVKKLGQMRSRVSKGKQIKLVTAGMKEKKALADMKKNSKEEYDTYIKLVRT